MEYQPQLTKEAQRVVVSKCFLGIVHHFIDQSVAQMLIGQMQHVMLGLHILCIERLGHELGVFMDGNVDTIDDIGRTNSIDYSEENY